METTICLLKSLQMSSPRLCNGLVAALKPRTHNGSGSMVKPVYNEQDRISEFYKLCLCDCQAALFKWACEKGVELSA